MIKMYYESAIQEQTIIEKATKGDKQAKQQLCQGYCRLITSLASRCTSDSFLKEELEQAGYIGLMNAAAKYDKNREIRFITYAIPWILGEMKMTMRFLLSGYKDYSLDSDEYHECSSHLNSLMCAQGIDVDHLDLRLAIQKLKHDERTLILLRYFRDKTQTEAAILLRKSQSQISRLEHRALSSLKEILS